ncbi:MULTISPECIES: hypothetical protein [Halorussus]|uniref:phage NrS-1 polymerase family protein n=1 Tax=Halorussus TaxID=1070314 RepID=UPI0020A19E44|nr:hypothetical protein [Halorussus vallis]USZ75020.1 hypothetical protein NGM07_16470 [Halorussus vallis]
MMRSPTPEMTTLPTASDIPESLLEYDQWVCWREQTRGEKKTKIPVNPYTGRYASTTDDETWGSFETAHEYALNGAAEGLGFVFCGHDPFVGIDLDDARNPKTETPKDWASDIIHKLNSYTEVSPSGTGFHVLIEGELPLGRNRRGDIELYETARFFTVTASHVETTPTKIIERTDALSGVYAEHVADEDEDEVSTPDEPGHSNGSTEPQSASSSESRLSDEELLSRARAASNSAKFERLWRGETHGYDSNSEADMALACLLAFWTGGDTTQMDRLFRQSGLLREKWDVVHYADGSTYGETTIDRAVQVTNEHYSPSEKPDEARPEDTTVTVDSAGSSSSAVDVRPSQDRNSTYEREQERIKTISTLERQLRELETENARLRDERDTERSKRKALENEVQEVTSVSRGIVARLKHIFTSSR